MTAPHLLRATLLALLTLATHAPAQDPGPWGTFRGNPRRTGNTDGKPGPASPRVVWAFKSAEGFVPSPVPAGDLLVATGLGGFNVSRVYALPLGGAAEPKPAWEVSAPPLKQPVVSGPALLADGLAFGDGMHQSSGGTLHGLSLAGKLAWSFPVNGELVHLESTPSAVGGRVVSGAGSGGVVCVDPSRLSLEGKEGSAAEIRAALDGRWKELLARYEDDKKKRPDFAVPPTDDQLPRPSPRQVWQQGQGRWHVDAPVNVAGGRVLAASAFLDKEKVGERALFCLDLADGAEKWRAALKYNPWGGAAVAGETAVVGTSSVGYYLGQLKGAKGELAAFDLTSGKEKWRKELPAGVVGGVALAGDAVVASCTDGKVRAFDLSAGERRWVYDARSPMVAAAAVAGDVVYAADLRGVLHAVNLGSGAGVWTLDVAGDPAVGAPGAFYGGPVVHGGNVYVATCNLEGPNAGKPCAVVCVGGK